MNFLYKFWHGPLRRPYKLAKRIDSGDGAPVLLIHGLGTSSLTWKPLVSVSDKKKWRMVAYDLLGFGLSPAPMSSSYDVEAHTSSLMASVDREIKKHGAVIIGHSMGCLIASHIAKKHPGFVKRLILYEPPLFADSPEFRSHVRRKKLYFALYNEIAKRPRLLLAYAKAALRFDSGEAVSLDARTWVAFEKSLRNTIMDQQAFDELKNVAVKTDIIYGKFDFVVTRNEVKNMLRANHRIDFHLVNEMHDVTTRSSKYISSLLNKQQPHSKPV